MALPTWQAAGTPVSGLGDITPVWPAHAANDVGLLVVESTIGPVATPTGWEHVTGSPLTTTGALGNELTVFWKRAASGAETNPTITDTGNHQGAVIVTVRGCITSGNPWNVVASDADETPNTAIDIPGATTTVANCLVIGIVSSGVDTGTQAAGSWANADLANLTEQLDWHHTTGDGGGFVIVSGEKAAVGLYGTTTATFVDSTDQCHMSIALRPSAALGLPAMAYRILN